MTRTHLIKLIILIALLVGVVGAFMTYANSASPPNIAVQYDDTVINLSADQRWILRSGDCVTVSWLLEGITSIYIDGEGKIGEGELEYCPVVNATSPTIEITDNDGVYRTFKLDILYLPDFVFYLLGFLGIAFAIIYSIYQLAVYRYDLSFPIWGMMVAVILMAIVGGVLRLSATEPDPINQQYDDISVSYWADHPFILFPDECVDVTWSVVGASQITFNGRDVTDEENPANGEHCAKDGDQAILDVVALDGQAYSHTIAIPSVFPHVEHTTLFFYWSLIGIILAALIYIPLIIQKIRELLTQKQFIDLLPIAGFFLFMVLLYLPFGLTSVGHWEEWIINAYLEGNPADIISSEMVSRFWVIVPHTLAYIISPESFVGYHLVNFLMFWGKLVLLYGIFRHLNVSRFYAFLVTMLFMIYPVNSALMSLRSFPMQFSMIALFTAIFLILDYRKTPSRLRLAGVWLALIFNVTSNESAYMIILVMPLLWYLQERRISWRNFNLTAIWYLYPAFKVAWLLFLSATDRSFYQSGIVNTAVGTTDAAPDNIAIFTRVMDAVFRNTFITGWSEAFASLNDTTYLLIALLMVGLTIGIGWWLSRDNHDLPSIPQNIGAMIVGLLLIIPSVGVLMWIPLYRNDLWRMYFYVPVGSAIAIFAVMVLLTRILPQQRLRNGILLIVVTMLMIPATVRLLNQHETYIQSADNKAQVLRSIVEQAPQVSPTSYIVLTTAMSNEQLQEREIFEFVRRDMLDSALRVIYRDHPPIFSYFCLIDGTCSTTDTELTLFYPILREIDYQDILLFEVYEDLSVKLLTEPPAELGFPSDNLKYDADELVDESANLPSRVATMLGQAAN